MNPHSLPKRCNTAATQPGRNHSQSVIALTNLESITPDLQPAVVTNINIWQVIMTGFEP